MVDFSLSTEQQMMVDTARRLVRELIIEPKVDMQLDKSGDSLEKALGALTRKHLPKE